MLKLTDEMRAALETALADGLPVIAASVGADGQPGLSFYGSAQVYDDDHLAIWVRNPQAGFLQRTAANPRVSLVYRNPAERVSWQFHGRAHPSDDEDVRRLVYDRSPQPERDRDPDRAGVAVLIEVDAVISRGQVIMARSS